MPWWLITIIVILGVIFILMPALIFNMSGIVALKMLKKTKENKMPKNMDISFYKDSPIAKLADEGLEYLKDIPKEEIHRQSFDGLDLHAFYIKNNEPSHKYFLGMHGFKSGPLHEFAPYVKGYLERGYNIMLASERAEYRSSGKYITLGNKEAKDARMWIDYIIEKDKDAEIIVEGVSMGGATVCILSGTDLPKNVKGIISDCAYSSVYDELGFFLANYKGVPKSLILEGIRCYLKLYLKIDVKKETPLEGVKKSKTPILFLQGKKDQLVPAFCANKLYDACSSKKKLIMSEEANHACSFAYLLDDYFKEVAEFFEI